MSAVVTQADRDAADRLWMATTGDWPRDLIEEDAETLNLFVQAFARRRSEAVEELVEVIGKVRDGYASQAKFADPEPAAYYREFVRRIDAALKKHRGEQG